MAIIAISSALANPALAEISAMFADCSIWLTIPTTSLLQLAERVARLLTSWATILNLSPHSPAPGLNITISITFVKDFLFSKNSLWLQVTGKTRVA